jgi:hypothetical protein
MVSLEINLTHPRTAYCGDAASVPNGTLSAWKELDLRIATFAVVSQYCRWSQPTLLVSAGHRAGARRCVEQLVGRKTIWSASSSSESGVSRRQTFARVGYIRTTSLAWSLRNSPHLGNTVDIGAFARHLQIASLTGIRCGGESTCSTGSAAATHQRG